MRWIVMVIVFLTALVAPALAQKTKIEAVNAKWTELFNKGDFDGLAQLYTADAIAFPPGSPMVKGCCLRQSRSGPTAQRGLFPHFPLALFAARA